MPQTRVFNIRWISASSKATNAFDTKPDETVQYQGETIVVQRR
jgi:hypothetical protein